MAIGKITSKSLDSNAVTSTNLAPGAVTIADIADGEITAGKLHTTLDLSTKTLTLTQASVTAHQAALSVTQSQISDLSTTTDLSEGTNLYYTNARADARVALLVDSAPGTLNTLNELAAALGDDPNFATTTANNIATKLPLAGGTMTGTLNVTQASTADTIKLTRGTTAHNNMIKFVTGSTDKWIVGQRNDNTDHFRFYSYGTSSDVLSIQTDGNVGIGQSTPLTTLHVGSNSGSLNTSAELFIPNGDALMRSLKIGHGGSVANITTDDSSKDITFTVGGSDRMRLTTDGDVSIGSDHSGFSGWRVLNMRQLSTGALINFEEDDGTRASTLAAWGSALRYQTHIAGGYHKFETDASTNAFQINDNGHVVVNTHQFPSNPTGSKLNVFGDGEVLRLDGTGNTSRTLRFRGCGTNGSANAIIESDGILQIKNEDANAHIYLNSVRDIAMQTTSGNGTAGNFTFSSYNTEIMRIDGANNRVGIGTTGPNAALDVDGAIISGNSSKPINATYDSGGDMNSFEHRFTRVKSGAGSPHVLVDIQFTSNFHQAMFVIEYGARLQAVSDSTTNAVIRSFGVNRFNGGNCNVTETNDTHFNSNVSSHAPIYINVVSQTRYQIVVNFSGTLGGSSFVSGSIRGYGVSSEFPTITFSDGLNGH